MKTKMLIAAGALAMLMTGCEPCKSASTEKTSLVTEKDKYSYALGAHFGNQARYQLVTRDSIDLDLDLFIQAFKERYNSDSAKFLMNDSVIMETLNKLSADRQAEKMKKDSLAAEKNKAEGEAFLAQNILPKVRAQPRRTKTRSRSTTPVRSSMAPSSTALLTVASRSNSR